VKAANFAEISTFIVVSWLKLRLPVAVTLWWADRAPPTQLNRDAHRG